MANSSIAKYDDTKSFKRSPTTAKRTGIKIRTLFCTLFFALAAEEIPIHLEHAVTPEQQMHGLMERTSLPADNGMTFNYPYPQPITIWMYNTKLDLDVAFLDESKVIREIHTLKSYPQIKDPQFFAKRSITSTFPALYVLEMNAGWFVSHEVKPGDKASWNIQSSNGIINRE